MYSKAKSRDTKYKCAIKTPAKSKAKILITSHFFSYVLCCLQCLFVSLLARVYLSHCLVLCVFGELMCLYLWMHLISSCRSWSRLMEFQLCRCCILKDKYSDIDILCCHPARVDILIKSPDIFFPHRVMSCDFYMFSRWRRKHSF